MKRTILLFAFVMISSICFSQSDSIPEPKLKLGHTFYLKIEALNSLARMAFAPNTFDVDLQGTIKLSNSFHWVNTYGKTTFDLTDSVPSIDREGVVMVQHRTGTALHRSSSMLRYYPFVEWENAMDYLFVEGGFHFQHYKGLTEGNVHDSLFVMESQFEQHLDFYRYGPQLNIGISARFADLGSNGKSIYDLKKPSTRISFSPEILIGLVYTNLHMINEEYVQLLGESVFDSAGYSESKLSFTIRAKIGIGLF